MLGPALVAGVAYLDPGNVASNLTAGSYALVLSQVVLSFGIPLVCPGC